MASTKRLVCQRSAVTVSRYLPCQIDTPSPPWPAYIEDMDQDPQPPRAMTIYRIFRIDGQIGWAIECNGQIIRTHPSAAVLGAYLNSILAMVNEYDADDIAKAIERQPSLSYEERMDVFGPTGRPVPSRELFPKVG